MSVTLVHHGQYLRLGAQEKDWAVTEYLFIVPDVTV